MTGKITELLSGAPASLPLDGTDGVEVTQNVATTPVSRGVRIRELFVQPINAQTGTTYTLVLTDISTLVTLSNASAITLTVPPNSSVAFPIGTCIDLMALGAGQVTVAAGAGVTLRLSGLTAKSRAQYSCMMVRKIATDTWSVMGDLAAS